MWFVKKVSYYLHSTKSIDPYVFVLDIDECIIGQNDCNRESQNCLNTKGNYTCIDKASKKTCPPGFKKNLFNDECEGTHNLYLYEFFIYVVEIVFRYK